MTSQMATSASSVLDDKKVFYNRFLLVVAGLGGLLYGVDVGIVAGALPYLEATSGFQRRPTLPCGCGCAAGSCDLHTFRRVVSGLDGTQIPHGFERHDVRDQHSNDCAVTQLWFARFRTAVAGR